LSISIIIIVVHTAVYLMNIVYLLGSLGTRPSHGEGLVPRLLSGLMLHDILFNKNY